ncbi:TRAP transporter large permease [Thermodesulfobacteriota bacterium]
MELDPSVIGALGFGVSIIFLFFGVHVAITLGFVGFLGIIAMEGDMEVALLTVGLVPFGQMAHYSLVTIPLFIFMGLLAHHSGMVRGVYASASKWIGHMNGGVGMATIVGCAAFAAVSGSSLACAATMGVVALPQMEELKYKRGFAAGIVAAGGTLGILIPPSTSMIIYGVITEQSIGQLFIAGIIPGVILALLLMFTVFIRASVDPTAAPAIERSNWKERFVSLKGTVWIALLFFGIMGGIYGGVFSAMEAAGIGAFGAFVITAILGKLSWVTLKTTLLDTTRTTCMVFAIIIGAMVFNYFIAISELGFLLGDLVASIGSKYAVLAFMICIYLVLGCFMDALAMILITIPLFLPVIVDLGFSPIWFGVIITIVTEMAFITPPVGMNIYVLGGVARHIPLWEIFMGALLFLPCFIVITILLIAFPELATFLVTFMM